MSTLSEIKIELQGIGYTLKNNNLAVPKYQRSYAWKEQNVEDLFQDIGSTIAEGSKEYFLGSVVISHMDSDQPEVVDGQQRLATTTILLAAIRDYFSQKKDIQRAFSINSNYLVNTDLSSLEMVPKLQLNEVDHNFYYKKILTEPDDPDRNVAALKDSHKRIEAASKIARSYIKKYAEVTNDPTKRLVELVEFIHQGAKVILVRVPDDANAFTIFETLNDRGLPLAITDLMKNYLFHQSGNKLPQTQYSWIQMTGTLEAVDKEEVIMTFIRHLWSSKYGLTRERELYSKVKDTITSKQGAIDFTQELAKNALLYAAILNNSHDTWNEYGSSAREHMLTLNELGMIQIRPLILAILDEFELAEVRKSLKILVSWSVRFLIYGGLGGGALESQYCQRAFEIRKGIIKSTKDLIEAMKVVPTDSQFKSAFENAKVSKNYLGRYYLRVLERQFRGEAEPELIPNSNEEIITLEHVLPENPSNDWSITDPETASSYFKRLGNMVLLTRKINSDIGNKGFSFKKPFLENSNFYLTKEISTYHEWGVSQIEERQKALAELAVKAWPNKI